MTPTDLQQAMTEFARVVNERDVAGAEQILDPAYALITVRPNAVVVPRRSWLDVLPEYVVHEWSVDEDLVDVDGDVAVVMQRVMMRATVLGKDRSGTFVCSDVWRRRDGQWRIWRRHSTQLDVDPAPIGG
jgi:ketosteroid isomerase-like protein